MGGTARPHLSDSQENTRQLIRELNAATRDALNAAKVLDAAVNRYAGSTTKHYKRVLEESDQQIMNEVTQRVNSAIAAIDHQFADLLSAATPDEMLHAIGERVSEALAVSARDGARHLLTERIIPELVSKEMKGSELRQLIRDIMAEEIQLKVGGPFGVNRTADHPPSPLVTAVQHIPPAGKNNRKGKRR